MVPLFTKTEPARQINVPRLSGARELPAEERELPAEERELPAENKRQLKGKG